MKSSIIFADHNGLAIHVLIFEECSVFALSAKNANYAKSSVCFAQPDLPYPNNHENSGGRM